MSSTQSTQTTFISSKNYSDATPLLLGQASMEQYGIRYNILTENKANLVLAFGGCDVKPCVKQANRPVLVVSQTEPLMATLTSVRARLIELLGIKEEEMKPLLVDGKGLMKSAPTLFVNITSKATLKDTQKQAIDYSSLLNKRCKMGLFIHVQSVFKNEAGMYSFIFRATQMILQEKPVDFLVVEQVDIGEAPADVGDLL